jgi:hypothetical protein
MGIDDRRRHCVDDDIDRLVLDHVIRYDSAGDWRDAENVDACRTRGYGIFGIRAIAGDVVADDDVIVNILSGISSVLRQGVR